jgi:LysM repeat protein
VNRSRFTRWAAPVAFLAVITIGALVIRAGFQNGKHPHPRPQTTTVASKTKKKTQGHHAKRQGQKTYTIVSGDTLGTIATKTGTTVARLMQLNPGIDPNALRVGQTIRVQ